MKKATVFILLFCALSVQAASLSVNVVIRSGSPVLTRYAPGFKGAELKEPVDVVDWIKEFNQNPTRSRLFKTSMKNLFVLQAPGLSNFPLGIMVEKFEAILTDRNGRSLRVVEEFTGGRAAIFDRHSKSGKGYYYCERDTYCNDLGWQPK